MIQWHVKGDTETFVISDDQLIQDFLARKTVRDDHKNIAHTLVELLERGKTLGRYSIEELASLALFVGYYYRVFLEQNEVEVSHVDSSENNPDQDSQQS
jgi:hypothetical protein